MSSAWQASTECKMVTIGRTGTTPLRFKGASVVSQRYRLADHAVSVILWRCNSGGFVAHLEIKRPNGHRTFARRVEGISDALRYLESLADEAPVRPEPKAGRGKRKPVADMAERLLNRSHNLQLQSSFAHLLSECSAAWAQAEPGEFIDR